jgi:O-antigen/teichoic acid export membrane protein
MFDKIKRLGTDTAVYGVSTIVGRFLTFLLTPLYANVLAPAELGVAATLYAYIAFLNVVYAYGIYEVCLLS